MPQHRRPPHFECVPYETRYRNPDPPVTIFNIRETTYNEDGSANPPSPWWVESINWNPDDHEQPVTHLDLMRVLAARIVARVQEKDRETSGS